MGKKLKIIPFPKAFLFGYGQNYIIFWKLGFKDDYEMFFR